MHHLALTWPRDRSIPSPVLTATKTSHGSPSTKSETFSGRCLTVRYGSRSQLFARFRIPSSSRLSWEGSSLLQSPWASSVRSPREVTISRPACANPEWRNNARYRHHLTLSSHDGTRYFLLRYLLSAHMLVFSGIEPFCGISDVFLHIFAFNLLLICFKYAIADRYQFVILLEVASTRRWTTSFGAMCWTK